MFTNRSTEHPVDNSVDKFAAFSYGRAKVLPSILCVECPTCRSLVHPRVRTFTRGEDGFDEVRGMCPFCGSINWVYNRQRERPGDGVKPRGTVRYVYKR